MKNPLSFGKVRKENAEEPRRDSSDAAKEKEKINSKKEVPHLIVEIPDAKTLPILKVSRKIAMKYTGSKLSL